MTDDEDGPPDFESSRSLEEQVADRPPVMQLHRAVVLEGPATFEALATSVDAPEGDVEAGLDWLVDMGIVLERDEDGRRLYESSRRHLEFRRADELLRHHGADALPERIRELEGKIAEAKAYFDAETPDAVDATDAETHEEIHERLERLTAWQNHRAQLEHHWRAIELAESGHWSTEADSDWSSADRDRSPDDRPD